MFDELMPFQPCDGGVQLHLKVTPKASANRIGKVVYESDGANFLKVFVTAPHDKGKANQSVIKLLAKSGGLAKSDIKLSHGHTHQRKVLHILGESETLMRTLKTCVTLE